MVRTFNLTAGAKPDKDLRIKLIQEEAQEFVDAVKVENVVEVIDALCDLLYVVYGAADVFDSGAITDGKYENMLVPRNTPDWPLLNRELEDFNLSINASVQAIRGSDFTKVRTELKDLAEGLWQCAAEGVGVDLKPFFEEVHRTNMKKFTGPKREDGKQLKPADWKPPRIEAMYQRWRNGQNVLCNVLAPVLAKEHKFNMDYRVEHREGGYHCGHCGGFFIDIGLDYTEDRKRGKPVLPNAKE